MDSEMSRLALPTPGERVGEYTVLAEIASGGMAAVFAVHRALAGTQKLLAMKLLLPNLAREARFVEMFLDEARIAARIQHPNVVPVFDVGTAEGRPFIVMELLHGQTLAALLERTRGEPLPAPLIYGILAQVARGLHGAHQAQGPDGKRLDVVHRDVSPHNVHVSYDGQVRVLDFGIAVARGRISSTRTGELKGKLAYLAPEQIDRAQVVGPKADLWSFGVLAYEALSGVRPFEAEDEARALWAVLHQAIVPLAQRVPAIDARVSELVERCLRRPIEERPASGAEIAAVFEEAKAAGPAAIGVAVSRVFAAERQLGLGIEQGLAAPSPIETAPTALRDTLITPPSRSRRWALTALSALAAATVIALWTAHRGPAPRSAEPPSSVAAPVVDPPPVSPSPAAAATSSPSGVTPSPSGATSSPSGAAPEPSPRPRSHPAARHAPQGPTRTAPPVPPTPMSSPSPTAPPPLMRNPY